MTAALIMEGNYEDADFSCLPGASFEPVTIMLPTTIPNALLPLLGWTAGGRVF